MALASFWTSVALLGWVYVGYPLLVWLASRGRSAWSAGPHPPRPLRAAVVIACHNEEGRIAARIQDVKRQAGWSPDLRVAVVADRCTDLTAAVAAAQGGVDVLEIQEGVGGRAAAHNAALRALSVDVAVFTDADTEFSEGFLTEILEPFQDPRVGCVVGSLEYRVQGSGIASSERSYFSLEKRLREAEATLGLLATGTGACMAVRASLFRPLAPAHDVDFVTPLDVVFQGYRVVMAPGAVAWDTPPVTPGGEWRVRIRQTSRNLSGTLRRWWEWRGWRFPLLTGALFSHKVLRWMTGLFLLGALGSSWVLWGQGALYQAAAVVQALAWGGGLSALALSAWGGRPGPMTTLGAFLWASMAMLVGCGVALSGGAQVTYEAAERTAP